MSEYIRTNKFDPNECPNIFVKEKLIRTNVRIYICDQYIRIFELSNIFVTLCSRHHQTCSRHHHSTALPNHSSNGTGGHTDHNCVFYHYGSPWSVLLVHQWVSHWTYNGHNCMHICCFVFTYVSCPGSTGDLRKYFISFNSLNSIDLGPNERFHGMGWDGMGYTVGTGVATAQKFALRPTDNYGLWSNVKFSIW